MARTTSCLSPDGKRLFIICGNHTQPPFAVKNITEPQTMGGIRSNAAPGRAAAEATSRLPANWDEDQIITADVGCRGPCRRDPRAGRLCRQHRSATAKPGRSGPAATAIPTTSPSTPTARCSSTTPTWSGTSARRGIAPRVSTMPRAAANSAGVPAPASGRPAFPDSLPALVDIGPGSPVGRGVRLRREVPRQVPEGPLHLRLDVRHDVCDPPRARRLDLQGREGGVRVADAAPAHRHDDRPGWGDLLHRRRPRRPERALPRDLRRASESTAPVDAKRQPRRGRRAEPAARSRGFSHARGRHAGGRRRGACRSSPIPTGSSATPPAIALEHQPLELWQDRGIAIADPRARIHAAIAVAQQAEPAAAAAVLAALDRHRPRRARHRREDRSRAGLRTRDRSGSASRRRRRRRGSPPGSRHSFPRARSISTASSRACSSPFGLRGS